LFFSEALRLFAFSMLSSATTTPAITYHKYGESRFGLSAQLTQNFGASHIIRANNAPNNKVLSP